MDVINEENFKGHYGKARKILTKPENEFYRDLLDECFNNSEYESFIKLSNRYLEVPPVKVFLLLNEERIREHEKNNGNHKGEIIDSDLKQAIGAYIGWIFQEKYNIKEKTIKKINILGVSTATWFGKH